MLGKISGFFWRIAGWKSFLAGLVIYIAFGAFVMPYGAKMFQQISGRDKVEILDLQLSYTPNKARGIIAEYGEEGRAFAAKFEMIADTVYPLAYTFLFIVIIAWIYKALARFGIVCSYIHLVPLIGMLADYCENICIIIMLKTYPGFNDRVASIGSIFTTTKWSLLGVELVIILVGLAMLIYQRYIKKPATVI